MRLHVTCSNPTRSLVLVVKSVRQILSSAGHQVGVAWPESLHEAGGSRRLGFRQAPIARSHLLIHVCKPAEPDLPPEVHAAFRAGTPVLRFEAGGATREPEPGEATGIVSRTEELPLAIVTAARSSVG
jgi:hypothetical protein